MARTGSWRSPYSRRSTQRCRRSRAGAKLTTMTAVATRLPPNPTPSRSSHSAPLTTATYTPIPPAVSSPYTTVRLISRSMSYSR